MDDRILRGLEPVNVSMKVGSADSHFRSILYIRPRNQTSFYSDYPPEIQIENFNETHIYFQHPKSHPRQNMFPIPWSDPGPAASPNSPGDSLFWIHISINRLFLASEHRQAPPLIGRSHWRDLQKHAQLRAAAHTAVTVLFAPDETCGAHSGQATGCR